MLITADQAIGHLRLDEVDPMMDLYLGAAEQVAIEFINRKVFSDAEAMAAAVLDGTAGDRPIVVNDAIKAAILLTLGHLYENREDSVIGTIVAQLPLGSRFLLQPYRIGMGV